MKPADAPALLHSLQEAEHVLVEIDRALWFAADGSVSEQETLANIARLILTYAKVEVWDALRPHPEVERAERLARIDAVYPEAADEARRAGLPQLRH